MISLPKYLLYNLLTIKIRYAKNWSRGRRSICGRLGVYYSIIFYHYLELYIGVYKALVLETSRSLHVLLKSLILIRFHEPEILV